jgi:hypothetical protein
VAYRDDDVRVAETSATTGTGAMSLSAAVTGHIRFNAIPSIATSDTLPYLILAEDNTWEAGIGTYSAANTLTRTTVQRSSNSNAAVSFAAGNKIVFLYNPGLARSIAAAASKGTPVDADILALSDSADSNRLKGLTWANLKATFFAALGALIAAGTNKATLVAADKIVIADSAASDATKYATFTNVLTLLQGTGSSATDAGFRGMPQNSQSAAYTLVLADSGKHLLHPSADTTARIWTIPANSSVAFPIGTAVTFINQNAGGVITISITTDTMRLAGAGTTGSRTLAANGIATAVKITSTEWLISGTGLT